MEWNAYYNAINGMEWNGMYEPSRLKRRRTHHLEHAHELGELGEAQHSHELVRRRARRAGAARAGAAAVERDEQQRERERGDDVDREPREQILVPDHHGVRHRLAAVLAVRRAEVEADVDAEARVGEEVEDVPFGGGSVAEGEERRGAGGVAVAAGRTIRRRVSTRWRWR